MEQRQCPIFAVSGIKNSGKTTFLERLLPLLTQRGLRVAVIKHDGHTFVPDVAGTDSDRLWRAGAEAVAVYCDTHYMIVETIATDYTILAERFQDKDLILVEGAKYSNLPKIELVRQACSSEMVCDKATVLAVATDCPQEFGVPKLALDDYEAAAELICEYMRGNQQ